MWLTLIMMVFQERRRRLQGLVDEKQEDTVGHLFGLVNTLNNHDKLVTLYNKYREHGFF